MAMIVFLEFFFSKLVDIKFHSNVKKDTRFLKIVKRGIARYSKL